MATISTLTPPETITKTVWTSETTVVMIQVENMAMTRLRSDPSLIMLNRNMGIINNVPSASTSATNIQFTERALVLI